MFKTPHAIKLALLPACLLLTAPAAFGQAFDAVRLFSGIDTNDRGEFGLALVSAPEYAGSDERRLMLFPALDYQWKNGFFAGTTNGLGYQFSSRPDIKYGLRITADFGRKESRSDALKGMGDIDPSAQIGGFFNYSVSREIFLTSSLRYGDGNDADGMEVNVGMGYANVLAPQWVLVTGATLSMVNANHMQSRFGVTPEQAASSGYAVYQPGSGLRDVRLNAALNHQYDSQTTFTMVLSGVALTGDAKDSPLTRRSSWVTGVLAVTRSF